MRVGVAHHLGWAVLVTADDDHHVVDRRRVELLGNDLPAAPIHHEGGPHAMHRRGDALDDDALEALVVRVRISALAAINAELERLETDLTEPVASLHVRAWPEDFPTDIATLRVAPYESAADSVMYRQVLVDVAAERGWAVGTFDARTVLGDAADLLGDRADEVLQGPRRRLGPPWTKDHRMALAATIMA